MSKKLADRKFVTFDSVQIDVDTIQALAYQLQQRNGVDASGANISVNVQVAVLMLESGSSVTIGDDSLKKFEHWWAENVKSEKVTLPAVEVETVAPPPAANISPPASPPAPAAQPTQPAPVAATPDVATPAADIVPEPAPKPVAKAKPVVKPAPKPVESPAATLPTPVADQK